MSAANTIKSSGQITGEKIHKIYHFIFRELFKWLIDDVFSFVYFIIIMYKLVKNKFNRSFHLHHIQKIINFRKFFLKFNFLVALDGWGCEWGKAAVCGKGLC